MTCEIVERDNVVGRYLAGRLGPEESEAFEIHYVACPRCQDLLQIGAVIRNKVRDDRARGVSASPASRKKGLVPVAVVAVAAALATVLILRPTAEPDRPSPGPTRDAAASAEAPTPLAPVGSVAAVTEFRWSSVEDADRYRITLFDDEARIVWEEETADTVLVRPNRTALRPGSEYFWKVSARVEWDRWLSSELIPFGLSPP